MIVTTQRQKNRLLKAGLDKETADVSDTRWSLSRLWNIVHEFEDDYEFPSSINASELMDALVDIICIELND